MKLPIMDTAIEQMTPITIELATDFFTSSYSPPP